MRYGVLSDTHGALHPDVPDVFDGVNEIFHAGDVGGERVLDELEGVAPVLAVGGNVEPRALSGRLPDRLSVEREGLRIVMLHGHLIRAAKPPVLLEATRDASPDLVIFGHTHEPLEETFAGVVFFNPGAAGRPRFRSRPTVGLIEISPGGLRFQHRALRLPWPR